MVRKPGKMYRNLAKKAYTRREYMGGVPGNKIVQFEMGNLSQEFPTEVDLIVEETCQIRHSALEASRISINRKLLKDVGRTNFHFKVRVFPHHVLRENKQATGAGADRVSEGMRLAFGKAVGTAARVEGRPDNLHGLFHAPVPGQDQGGDEERGPQTPDPVPSQGPHDQGERQDRRSTEDCRR